MRKRAAFCIFFALMLSVLFCICASATEQGYIFELKENASEEFYRLAAQQTALSEENGVYLTTDASLIFELRRNRAVEYCEPDEPVTLQDAGDEFSALMADDWKRSMLGYSYAKKNGVTGRGVRIGIIDSGLSPAFAEHTAATVLPGFNFISGNYNTTDTFGHGTFVASVIAHEDYGIADEVSIVPLKAFDDKNSNVSKIVSAIYAAVDSKDYFCDVLNMSCTASTSPDSLLEAIKYAASKGLIIVAAVGNGSSTKLMYPAAYDEVIGVGSLNSKKIIAASSQRNKSVCVCAPGSGVNGMAIDGSGCTGSGTSYSTPLVTATAALALQQNPELTTEEFSELLRQSAEDLGEEGWDSTYGWGLLNVGLLLAIQRGDMQSAILSAYDGRLCLSYAEDACYRTVLAQYDAFGQMFEVRELPCGTVSNEPLAEDTQRLCVFVLQNEAFLPVRAHE